MELMTPEVRWDHNGGELIATKKIQNLKQQKTFLTCGYVEKYVEKTPVSI